MNKQDTPTGAPEKKGTLDFDALAEELDVDRKVLENSLTGDETHDEAILKMAKKSGHAQAEMSKAKQDKVTIEKQLKSFVQETTKKAVETEGEEEPAVTKESKTPETQKTPEQTIKIQEDMARIEKQLGIIRKDTESLRNENRQMRVEQVNERKEEKAIKGMDWLVETFGEERAYELFNPANLKSSPIGRILNSDTNPSAELYWQEKYPIKLATIKYLTDMGLEDEMAKALKSSASLTEPPGGNVPSEKGKEGAVEKLSEMIFGPKK